METIKTDYLFKLINEKREEEELHVNTYLQNLEEEELQDLEFITIIQCIGLLAYEDHYVRKLVTKELLKKTHYSVSDFCKENKIQITYGELIGISKSCSKENEKQGKIINTKINKNNKEVKLFDISVLKKVMQL